MPTRADGVRSGRAALLLLPVFFLSGFAALLYQMIWQRILTFFGGADVYSVTLIVAAFMAGLGFGSLAGGRLADSLRLRARFLAFAASELAIAAFALVSVPLFYGQLYQRLGEWSVSGPLTALVLFVVLLWPTFFMGVSLPLLAKTIGPTGRSPEDWVGLLYGFNTLGAAVGALATVWWLVRQFGFETCVQAGALMNLSCGLVALGLAWALPAEVEEHVAPSGAATAMVTDAPAGTFSLRTWFVLYALSGYIALSLEIVWFRVLGVILKSNAFTFGTLLAIYLTGVGGGALVGSRWARRSAAPGRRFLLLQSAIPLYAALALALFVAAVGHWPGTYALAAYAGDVEPLNVERAMRLLGRFVTYFGQVAPHARHDVGFFLVLYGLVPLFLIGPPTLLMGLSFPFLQKAAQTDPRVLGRRVGLLQAANILGSTCGAVLTGVLTLHLWGSAVTLRLLVVLGLLFPVLLVRRVTAPGAARRARLAAVAALGALAVALTPGGDRLWAALHAADAPQVIVDEDATGLAVLKHRVRNGQEMTIVLANGLGQSELPYGGYHTILGAFPVLLHPEPRSVAIIGLGSGDTLFGAGGRASIEHLDCIEIVQAQLPALRTLARQRPYAGLRALLTDGRVHYTFADGREVLMRSGRRYDVIEADALRPTSAFAGSLYSLEYFELLRRRLNPGGLAVSWSPTPRTYDTFVQAFPHVLFLGDALVGSEQPIVFDRATILARAADPQTNRYYRAGGVDIVTLMRGFLGNAARQVGPGQPRAVPADVNTDLFPKDEYLVPAVRRATTR